MAVKAETILTAKQVEDQYGIDLITAETIRNALIQVTRQMHSVLMRGAYSTVVRDIMDMAVCVHLVGDSGVEMVAITEGCTQFAFTVQHNTNIVLREYGIENVYPGDVIFCNDPFRGSIHFPDVNLVRLVYWEGKPVFAVTDTSHFVDIGGPVAGGFANGATSIYEEGLRVGPTLLYARDKPVRSTFNLLIENTRIPSYALGDARALYGALRIGERLLLEMIQKYGLAAVQSAARYTLDHAERMMRAAIKEIPDGTYVAEDYLDDDGLVTTEPVKFKVALTVKNDNMEIDFSGSHRQPLGNTATAWQDGGRAILGVKMVVEPETPMNGGSLRPFDVLLPAGSVVCALPPTSVSNHIDVGGRVVNVVTEALSRAFPERGIACDVGTASIMLLGGLDARPGHEGIPWGLMLGPGGGWGATHKADGLSYCILPIGNCRDAVSEHIEQEAPLVLLEKEMVIDSGGAGEHAGAPATQMTLLALSDIYLSICCDRVRFSPPGEDGGGAGSTGYCFLVEGEYKDVPTKNGITPLKYLQPVYGTFDEQGRPDPSGGEYCRGSLMKTGKFSNFVLHKGQILRTYTSGAGGYGDPLQRSTQLVQRDVRNELVSPKFAADAYGVVIDPKNQSVDEAATTKLRTELHAKRQRGEWRVPVAVHSPWPREASDGL